MIQCSSAPLHQWSSAPVIQRSTDLVFPCTCTIDPLIHCPSVPLIYCTIDLVSLFPAPVAICPRAPLLLWTSAPVLYCPGSSGQLIYDLTFRDPVIYIRCDLLLTQNEVLLWAQRRKWRALRAWMHTYAFEPYKSIYPWNCDVTQRRLYGTPTQKRLKIHRLLMESVFLVHLMGI